MQIFIYCNVTLHVSGVTAPIIRSTKIVTAASGTGHNTGTATTLQRGRLGHVIMKTVACISSTPRAMVYGLALIFQN